MRFGEPINVPCPSEEDAFIALARFMRQPREAYGSKYGYEIYLPQVMAQFIIDATGQPATDQFQRVFQTIAPPFFSAAWEMCRRGILRPGVKTYSVQSTDEGHSGCGFTITETGKKWLQEAGDQYDLVPSHPGRFSKLLSEYGPLFGEAYLERAQEAVTCYSSLAYLACCAMCGAAAESIYLAIATAKSGDRSKVETEYANPGGRGRIEKLILDPLPKGIQSEFRGYVSLLKYWRDASAHGAKSGIDDAHAFTSLGLLLRFAQFASDKWNDLTNVP